MANKNLIRIRKMSEYLRKILLVCEGINFDQFSSDFRIYDVCILNLIEMGEMARLITEEFKLGHMKIPWHKLNGMRNRFVHDYEDVNLLIIWETICDDLPRLQQVLADIPEEARP